jgi:hypothetical protein
MLNHRPVLNASKEDDVKISNHDIRTAILAIASTPSIPVALMFRARTTDGSPSQATMSSLRYINDSTFG